MLATVVVCALAALLATGAAGSSKRAVVINFEKDCPELTCWETPGSPVEVDTTITPVDFEDPLFHYTTVETFSSSKGSVTVSLAGVLDTSTMPQETVLKGYVIRGSWNGKNLAGADVRAKAHRVFADRSIFAGKVTISR
ncbi:MAG: hypothetical protein ACRDNG_05875 [Gaiellaceae bacterium]